MYAHACNLLREMTKAYDDALEKYDVLLMPTVKYVATKLPEAEANMLGTAPYYSADSTQYFALRFSKDT